MLPSHMLISFACWLLAFYAFTKRQKFIYLHMLGDIACWDPFHQSAM